MVPIGGCVTPLPDLAPKTCSEFSTCLPQHSACRWGGVIVFPKGLRKWLMVVDCEDVDGAQAGGGKRDLS
jgi:hypothetical protein